MTPASATRPEAVTIALLDATWPLLMPIATLLPLGQAAFLEAIWTFHEPSKVAAEAARRPARGEQKGLAMSTLMLAAGR